MTQKIKTGTFTLTVKSSDFPLNTTIEAEVKNKVLVHDSVKIISGADYSWAVSDNQIFIRKADENFGTMDLFIALDVDDLKNSIPVRFSCGLGQIEDFLKSYTLEFNVKEKLTLKRVLSSSNGIFGTLTLPSGRVLHTLELEWNDNEQNISCIPSGTYSCRTRSSTKFGEVYEVLSVPNRTDILIHRGNTIKDIQGCILVGLSSDAEQVYDSRAAVSFLLTELNKKPFTLNIQ